MKDQKQKSEIAPDPAPEKQLSLRQRVDRSLLISLVAVAISLIGTVVSVYEAGVLRDQQSLQAEQKSASVWPYVANNIDISAPEDSVTVITFTVENLGIGPAILGDVRYLYKEKSYETYSIGEAIQKSIQEANQHYGEKFRVTSVQNWQIDSLVIPPQKDVRPFTLQVVGGKNYIGIEAANFIVNQLSIQFCYCSVYGDCWYRGEGVAPIKNPDCSSYITY